MASDPSNMATRQTFNVAMGWAGVLLGVLLGVSGALASGRSLMCFGIAAALLSFCVMVRPYIRFTADAVVVSNVLREVTLPWEGISHATSRGSLVLVDNDNHKTTVWAIGSQKARNVRTSDDDGLRSWRPVPGSLTEIPTSSRALSEAINAETVDNPVDAPSGRTVRWLALPVVLMGLAGLCAVFGLLT